MGPGASISFSCKCDTGDIDTLLLVITSLPLSQISIYSAITLPGTQTKHGLQEAYNTVGKTVFLFFKAHQYID